MNAIYDKEDPEKLSDGKDLWLSSYNRRRNKFEVNFLSDGGRFLKNLIINSVNSDTPWEFPKGRKHNNETDITTAIREFEEETCITPADYSIEWNLHPYVESYIDFGINYHNVYYFATISNDWQPKLYFSSRLQVNEICDIRWITSMDIPYMFPYGRIKPTLKTFKNIHKRYKKNHRI